MTREHTTTSPFVALEAQWLAASASADRALERVDECIASVPEALDWTRKPQMVKYGIRAAEFEAEAAVDRLNAAEHAIIGTPANGPSDLAVKFKVLRLWAGMFGDDPGALDWILDAIAEDFERLTVNPAIAA